MTGHRASLMIIVLGFLGAAYFYVWEYARGFGSSQTTTKQPENYWRNRFRKLASPTKQGTRK